MQWLPWPLDTDPGNMSIARAAIIVCPATSREAERSFSALRRLKTWLRNSLSKERLNHAAVCHVHKERLDEVSDMDVAAEFACKNAMRRAAFGNF